MLFIYFEMATSEFEEQRIIIRFLHLCGMKLIKIHQQVRHAMMALCGHAIVA